MITTASAYVGEHAPGADGMCQVPGTQLHVMGAPTRCANSLFAFVFPGQAVEHP